MPTDLVFQFANLLALLGWIALIVLPRRRWVRSLILGMVALLCLAYATLVAVYFFPSGGGFGSLDALRRLFASPPVLLAGWLHYLAFDLFTGCWIAARLDARGISRWLQAPMLAVTFMLGPVGLLLAGAALLASARLPGPSATARRPLLQESAA